MMGERRVMQEARFYGFSLERHVPNDHLLRKIDRFVDLSEVRAHLELRARLEPYYSEVGRPSIDPALMMSKFDCEACALKPKCRPNAVARKIARSIYEAACDKARAVAKTAGLRNLTS
jgi:hypothetical protein